MFRNLVFVVFWSGLASAGVGSGGGGAAFSGGGRLARPARSFDLSDSQLTQSLLLPTTVFDAKAIAGITEWVRENQWVHFVLDFDLRRAREGYLITLKLAGRYIHVEGLIQQFYERLILAAEEKRSLFSWRSAASTEFVAHLRASRGDALRSLQQSALIQWTKDHPECAAKL